jgi:acyl-CoA thioester hydrolase
MTTNQTTPFTLPVRVYYEDTDTAGVVYYANYLKFMERARTEWLRSLGIEQDQVRDQHGVVFAVRRAEVDYLQPARFNQLLEVTAHPAKIGRASITFAQEVRRQGDATPLLCSGRVRVACLDQASFRPTPIPEALLMEFQVER